MEQKPDKLKSGLIGGVIIGLLSIIPGINFINCFCCAGVVIGGIVSVNLYRKNLNEHEVTYADGAILGLMSGSAGALINTILGSLIGGSIQSQINRVFEMYPEIPPELEDILLQAQEASTNISFIIVGLFFSIIIYSIFGIIGGFIAVSLAKKKAVK